MSDNYRKISVKNELPNENQHVDILVKEHIDASGNHCSEEWRTNYIYCKLPNGKFAFQEPDFYECGLYDMAYSLDENLVTHWTPAV